MMVPMVLTARTGLGYLGQVGVGVETAVMALTVPLAHVEVTPRRAASDMPRTRSWSTLSSRFTGGGFKAERVAPAGEGNLVVEVAWVGTGEMGAAEVPGARQRSWLGEARVETAVMAVMAVTVAREDEAETAATVDSVCPH